MTCRCSRSTEACWRLSLPADSGEHAPARAALPLASRVDVGVHFVEGMAADAVCLASVHRRRPDAAQTVLPAGDRLQVAWPDAQGHAAQVVRLLTLGDQADRRFIRPTMRRDVASVDADAPIASSPAGASPHPQPAWSQVGPERRNRAGLVDPGPEPVLESRKVVSPVSLPTVSMGWAHTAPWHRRLATVDCATLCHGATPLSGVVQAPGLPSRGGRFLAHPSRSGH
jgi:hypothetical protein